MKLELVAHSTDIEALIATAMLTTTSGSRPSTLYHRLLGDPERVAGIVGRLESQHGSVLEHNRLCWLLEASEGEVIDIVLRSRFFNLTRLGCSRWLVSANLRAMIECAERWRDEFTEALLGSVRGVAPTLYGCFRGGGHEG